MSRAPSMHSQGSQGTGRRAVVLALIAPAILVGVALLQLYLTHSHDLSPWKGGGFGMFASVDRVEHRTVRAAFQGSQAKPINVHAFATLSFPDRVLVDRALSMPTAPALQRLAERIDELSWSETPTGVLVPSSADDPPQPLPATAYPEIVLSVWRVQYDAAENVATPVRLRELTLERQP